MMGIDYAGLQHELERTDPVVKAAAESYERMRESILAKFHLTTRLPGDMWISTMYDGNMRPGRGGPYETCIFGTDRVENPTFHWRTAAMAESAHRKFVVVLGRATA